MKYELITIDGFHTLDNLDEFQKELLRYTESKDQFSEEFRISNSIKENDFYMENTYISEISFEEYSKICTIQEYTCQNDELVKMLDKDGFSIIKYFIKNKYSDINLRKNDVITKYKPSKCLYENQIISKYVKFIYCIHIGDTFLYYGEY